MKIRKWCHEPETKAEGTIKYFLTGKNSGYSFTSVTSCGGICKEHFDEKKGYFVIDKNDPSWEHCCSNREKLIKVTMP